MVQFMMNCGLFRLDHNEDTACHHQQHVGEPFPHRLPEEHSPDQHREEDIHPLDSDHVSYMEMVDSCEEEEDRTELKSRNRQKDPEM